MEKDDQLLPRLGRSPAHLRGHAGVRHVRVRHGRLTRRGDQGPAQDDAQGPAAGLRCGRLLRAPAPALRPDGVEEPHAGRPRCRGLPSVLEDALGSTARSWSSSTSRSPSSSPAWPSRPPRSASRSPWHAITRCPGRRLSHVSEHRTRAGRTGHRHRRIAIAILLVNIGEQLDLPSGHERVDHPGLHRLPHGHHPDVPHRQAGWPEDQGRTGLFTLPNPLGCRREPGRDRLRPVHGHQPDLATPRDLRRRQLPVGRRHRRRHRAAPGRASSTAAVCSRARRLECGRGAPRAGPGQRGAERCQMSVELPARAQVVVIGGGIIGASVAYHLTQLGWTDVVCSSRVAVRAGRRGTPRGWSASCARPRAAPGWCSTRPSSTPGSRPRRAWAPGYKRCGGVTVARTPERMVQLRRTAATAEAYDLDCELIAPERGRRSATRSCATDDLLGAIWLPGDGTANPTDLTSALAKGARKRGVPDRRAGAGHRRAHRRTARVTGVRTDQGDIEAEVVVNCAGQWAKAVGALAGVTVPLHSAEHFYVVTEQIEGVHRDLPILRDPDGYTYVKEEVGGLVVGGFEPVAKPWVAPDQMPYPFEFQLLDEDWEHFAILMDSAVHRIPALRARPGSASSTTGRRASRPDNQFILGEAPEVRGLLRRRRVQLGRHRVGRRCRARARRVDRRRRADQRPDRGRHPPVRAVQRQQPVAARPGRRGARAALRRALAQPRAETARPFRRSPVLRPARAAGAPLRLQDGLGAGQRLRPAGRRRRSSIRLGQAELAAVVRRRAARHPRRRRALRPDVVRASSWSSGRDAERAAAVAVHRRRRRPGRARRSTPGCSTRAAATRPTSR